MAFVNSGSPREYWQPRAPMLRQDPRMPTLSTNSGPPAAPGHSIHEVSYRACFKPQLPRFFIERLTSPGDVVYDRSWARHDPNRAALLGRVPFGNDLNPLSIVMTRRGCVPGARRHCGTPPRDPLR